VADDIEGSAAADPRARRGRDPARSREMILRAARRQFAEDGYHAATVRSIAAEAQIDPTMVIRYFNSKDDLFAAAMAVDLCLPDFSALPRDQLGTRMVGHFLRRWEGDLADDVLGILLRSAATHPAAADRLRQLFTDQVSHAIAAVAPDHPRQRAALAASQLLGLALCRYVLELPGLVETPPDTLAAQLGDAIQHYLVEPLPHPDEHPAERPDDG
jgi:AcrR family transcriptional regulator